MNWMAWTLPTALFFAGIGTLLVIMTLVELRWPTSSQQGFLPMPTTRGDRVFISLLSAAFIHLAVLGLGAGMAEQIPMSDGRVFEGQLWPASILSIVWAGIVLRWG